MRRSSILITLLSALFILLSGAIVRELEKKVEANQQTPAIDKAQAEAFALRIQDLVTKGNTSELKALLNKNRFIKKALVGYDTRSENFKAIAEGAGMAFESGSWFDSMSMQVKEGGDFLFVKIHHRNGEPALQFRQVRVSGELVYLDLSIFRAEGGGIGIEDVFLYVHGQWMSKMVIEETMNTFPEGRAPSAIAQKLPKALELIKEGKMEEGCSILESLPNDFKQRSLIMRLRIHCANQLGSKKAEALINEYKVKFPDDTSLIFSRFTAALLKEDFNSAAGLIDEIYKAVRGDDYLLSYKLLLLALQKKYKEAVELLSKMENEHDLDISSFPDSLSPEEREQFKGFLASEEYKAWLSRRPRR